MLGRTKDQIRSLQQVNDAKVACEALKLDALVIVGGEGYVQFATIPSSSPAFELNCCSTLIFIFIDSFYF